jgi:hypothetical protein
VRDGTERSRKIGNGADAVAVCRGLPTMIAQVTELTDNAALIAKHRG